MGTSVEEMCLWNTMPPIMANSKESKTNILTPVPLALTVQKLLPRLKFQRGGQNYRMKEWQTGQKQYAPQSTISGA